VSVLLSVDKVEAAYGVSPALFGVSLEVREGEAVALMGRNGMGKTTTVKTICGLLPHTAGRIAVAGKDTRGLAPHRIARLGIGLVPEGRRCFAPLTVEENLIAAARPGHWDFAAVSELFPRLAERRRQTARTLSGGEQQMLAIGRALMTNPKLLILDEATEGLAPAVRQEIWRSLHKLKTEGLSILVIDKSLAELSTLVDRYVIIEKGADVWEGKPVELTADIAARHLGIS
tara:strand:+ start:429 stop:1121 length:693 start_codon:yes stop_codon:yes gene_type:complete